MKRMGYVILFICGKNIVGSISKCQAVFLCPSVIQLPRVETWHCVCTSFHADVLPINMPTLSRCDDSSCVPPALKKSHSPNITFCTNYSGRNGPTPALKDADVISGISL